MNRKFASTFTLLFSLLVISSTAQAFNIYRVGDVVHGREHNEMLNRWIERDFSIWVGVDEGNNEYIFFKGDTGLSTASVMVDNTKSTREKFTSAVSKAIEWSGVAKKNKADTTKGLGCFGVDKYGLCEKNSSAFDEGQMSLKFFSANSGNQTDLIVDIIDRDNQFYKASIYIETSEMKKLLSAAKGIEAAFVKARETAKNQDLFK
ncbi:MAG: hypothetical protein SV775_15555 [Thermodesulfobacteriota bacterium]|nr:hypothetical protein [Thermodesulfobacteriota bacterium]